MDGTGKLFWIVPSDIPDLKIPDRTFGYILADDDSIVLMMDEDKDLEKDVDLTKPHQGTQVWFRAREIADKIFYASRVSEALFAAKTKPQSDTAGREETGQLFSEDGAGLITPAPGGQFTRDVNVDDAGQRVTWDPVSMRRERHRGTRVIFEATTIAGEHFATHISRADNGN